MENEPIMNKDYVYGDGSVRHIEVGQHILCIDRYCDHYMKKGVIVAVGNKFVNALIDGEVIKLDPRDVQVMVKEIVPKNDAPKTISGDYDNIVVEVINNEKQKSVYYSVDENGNLIMPKQTENHCCSKCSTKEQVNKEVLATIKERLLELLNCVESELGE